MKIPGPLVQGTFIRRDNRFRATVLVEGREAWAHVPNSGRLHELFIPGTPVLLRPANSPHRRTAYDLLMVIVDGQLVSLDSRLPSRLFAEAARARALAEFQGYEHVREEVRMGRSRIDVLLEGPRGRCWVEAKSVTLVENGTAYFPDAVTARGKRHVEDLAEAVAQGDRAAVVFVIQRADALRFRPHDASDPAFGQALRDAAAAGVEVYAYRCHVTQEEIVLTDRVPVLL